MASADFRGQSFQSIFYYLKPSDYHIWTNTSEGLIYFKKAMPHANQNIFLKKHRIQYLAMLKSMLVPKLFLELNAFLEIQGTANMSI